MGAERKFTQRITTEGADKAAADLDNVAAAEQRLVDAQQELAETKSVGDIDEIAKSAKAVKAAEKELGNFKKTADDTSISTEKLTSLLTQISPELGQLADATLKSVSLFGELGTKSLSLNGLMTAGKAGVLKYKDSLLLLGAGGAAVGSLFFLMSVWKKLGEEMEKTIKIAEDFQKSQSRIGDIRDQARDAVLKNLVKSNPDASIEEVEKTTQQVVNDIENLGIDPDRSARIRTQQEAPPSDAETAFRRKHFGPGALRESARRQLLTFDPGYVGFLGGRGPIDTGLDNDLKAFIKNRLGEQDDGKIKELIRAAQVMIQNPAIAAGTSKRTVTPSEEIDKSVFDSSLRLLERLKILPGLLERAAKQLENAAETILESGRKQSNAAQHLEDAARANAEVEERRSRRVLTTQPWTPRGGVSEERN